jgi:HlyD family secretion protein
VIIADLSELITKLDIDELDVGQVKPGQHVVVKAQGIRDLQFAGTVERVGLMGREQSGAVLFVVEVAVNDTQPLPAKPSAVAEAHPAAPTSLPRPRDILRPGMSAQAEIEVQHIDDAIVVPVACVLEATGGESGKSDRVFVVDGDGKRLVAHEVAVKLGPSEDDGIVVTQGLQEGQRVVEGPYRALRALEDGDRVTLDDGKSDKHDDDASNKSGSKPNKKGKG